ncbi:hypothetical protein [uncultured Jannaschia sp.]|uniref:hypothetical protein n=1 Tax=uncultured Jannaschia sp. TaxID=293347 RepID=UPI002624271D|nr:hypothetical protein [uncultured Jannaschia sp.]
MSVASSRKPGLPAAALRPVTTGPRVGPGSVHAMRRLWCAVLYEQVRLAISTPSSQQSSLAISQAVHWIGSRDFRFVCELAGLDPDWIERGIARTMAQGKRLRARRPEPKELNARGMA